MAAIRWRGFATSIEYCDECDFATVGLGTECCSLLVPYFVSLIREMMVYNNQTVSRVEGAAASLVRKLIDGQCHSCRWLVSVLRLVQLSSHIFQLLYPSRKGPTLSPRTMTYHLHALTQSHVNSVVIYSRKYVTLLGKMLVERTSKVS